MKTEIWKDIEGFPGYQASDQGYIRSFRDYHGNITKTFKILTPRINKDGYYELSLYTADRRKITKRVHRLIAITFMNNNDGLVVNHINGNKLDNRLENLEFVTAAQNSTLASETGLYRTKPIRIVETGEIFRSIKECADTLNSHPSNLSNALSDKKPIKGLHLEFISEDEYIEYRRSKETPFLYPHQAKAVEKMFDGCILNGGVGSGKSRTGLYYYFKEYGGSIDPDYVPMKNPCDLVIITTAKKRNDKEWEAEMCPFLMTNDPETKKYDHNIVIDSWQNIQKYTHIENAFFIFDEDHVTGTGAWVKAFYKITKRNRWIILSATSGDRWEEYIPVFVANGFYRNKSEFQREHIVYSPYVTKYPKVDRYINTGRLIRLRNKILIDMDFDRHTVPHHEDIFVKYDVSMYKEVGKTRWNPYKNAPMMNAAELCYVWRQIVNTDDSRQVALLELFEKHPRMIVFYNYNYERDILLNLHYGDDVEVAEWSGHKHEPIPESERWIYIVQYTAGCEGFNCIKTDTIVFYSQNYSYKTMIQAAGRIDRLNTPYTDLHYYHLKSRSGIDLAISKALREKKSFNERRYVDRILY